MPEHRTAPSRNLPLVWRLVLACVPLLASCAYVSTAPFEGVVRDASTGEPIPGVLVECDWVGAETGLVPVDQKGKLFRIEQTVTDREGRYEIPAVWFVHVKTLQVFSSGGCSFSHPIYKGTGFSYRWKKRHTPECVMYEQFYQEHAQDGAIRYDIELVPLEEYFNKPEDVDRFSSFLRGQYTNAWPYRKAKYGVRYDTDAVLSVWTSINDSLYAIGEHPDLSQKRKEINDLLKGGY